MVVSVTNDESNSSNESDSSSSEDDRNYMALASIVKSDSDKDTKKVENADRGEGIEAEFGDDKVSEDNLEICEAYY